MKIKYMYIYVKSYNYAVWGQNLKFGDKLHGFHISQVSLQELATMDLLDVVLQWSCGLTGEQA